MQSRSLQTSRNSTQVTTARPAGLHIGEPTGAHLPVGEIMLAAESKAPELARYHELKHTLTRDTQEHGCLGSIKETVLLLHCVSHQTQVLRGDVPGGRASPSGNIGRSESHGSHARMLPNLLESVKGEPLRFIDLI